MKRLRFFIAAVILAFVGTLLFIDHQRSFGTIKVSLESGVKGEITKPKQGEGPNKPQSIISFQSSYAGKLKKGSYALNVQASSDYETKVVSFTIGSQPTLLNIRLNYSDSKLQQLLQTEQPMISQVFRDRYLVVAQNYSLTNGRLFGRGEWYGGLLTPTDTSQDTLRFAMNKKDGKWSVVTDPPEIILSLVVYPDIPEETLQAVNSL